MPHNLRKKRNPASPNDAPQPDLEHLFPFPDHGIEHATNNDHTGTQVPFYDDSNHIVYGWQQMGALPDFPGLHALVQGTQDNFSMNPESQPQTWPTNERQQVARSVEPSRFNPYPRHDQGLRYPPFLTKPRDSGATYHAEDYNTPPDSNHVRDGTKVMLHEVNEMSEVKEEMNSLTMAITQMQLFTPTQITTNKCEYRSSVPDPLGLAATRIAKEEKTDSTKLKIHPDIVPEENDRSGLHRARNRSAESFVTDFSSEFENLSLPDSSKAEHNSFKGKWYRGFYRLE